MIPPISPGDTALSAPQIDKLRKGARDFEAMMMQQLWNGMREPKEEGSSETGSSETLTELGMQAMASGMAARGGLGISKMILQHYAPPLVPPPLQKSLK
jgi:Rod binding domain-containing protein